MTLGENKSISNGLLNGVSHECSDHQAHEVTGIDVFKQYMLKLLPYNTTWVKNISNKHKSGLVDDPNTCKNGIVGTTEESWPANIEDTACALEIAISDTAGRYLKVNRNITAGEVLIVEPPIVLATRPKSPPHCFNCYKLTNSFKCPDCGFFLCGPECITEDHIMECQILKRLGAVESSDSEHTEEQLILERLSQMPAEKRAQAQALLEKARAASKEQKHMEILQQYVIMATLRTLFVVQNSEFYKNLLQLMQANLDCNSQRYQMNQKLIVDVIVNRLKASTDTDLVHQICSIWDTNAFQVVLPQNSRVQGLFPFAALINHDCRPNSQQWFSSRGELVLRATDNISKGDMVTISYTDPQWSTIVRQNHLQNCKQFTCTCTRCYDPTEFGTFVGSLVCSCCSCPLVSSGPLDTAAPWICTSSECSHTIQAIQRDDNKILSIGANYGDLAQKINPRDVTAVVSLARVLQRQVHPNHFSLMQLYMAVINALVDKDLSELSDEELSRLSGISAQVMKVGRVLQSPLARITASTAREDLRLRLESIRRDKSSGRDIHQRLTEMSVHLQECVQVLNWDPSMPSSAPLLQTYQDLIKTS